jgi:UDP-galactopyranose mutase
MVQQLLREERIENYIAWLYTPMALPLCEGLKPQAVVYDCMDELSAFLNAPPRLLEHEAHLLKLADVVFTGGPSLYRAKKDSHQNVLCFPSSVDAKHFAAAASGMIEAADQRALAHPRLGYFGVIDERIDTAVLRAMAEAHPEWQIVMVGPVVKIDPAILPRNSNLHYLGQRTYPELPSYLAGWDVCLLPFARNASTRFISPTKTLEYMAAKKPIVSTPITDVAEPYGDIVYLSEDAEAFVAACERALAAPAADRAARRAKMREVLSRTSWDRTARSMQEEIRKAIEKRPAAGDGREVRTASRSGGEARVLIAGAGPTGLSAAYHIGDDALVLEQNDRVGGWCRSIEVNGFTFDYAGHIMFSNEPYVHQLYKMLLGENVHWQDREAWIYSKNVYTRYPFQGSLHGLPPEVIKECVMGAIEARFGPLKSPRNAAGANGKANGMSNGNGHAATCKPGPVNDCCADGILEAAAPLGATAGADGRAPEPRNFEEFIYKVWGSGIARHFAIPYNRKLWAVPL